MQAIYVKIYTSLTQGWEAFPFHPRVTSFMVAVLNKTCPQIDVGLKVTVTYSGWDRKTITFGVLIDLA